MENKLTIPNCSHCGSVLKEITTKNGRKIYACGNWKFDGTGCQGDIYDPHREQEHKVKYPLVAIRHNIASKSEAGKFRTVEAYESGDIRCNCICNSMGRDCRHIKETVDYFRLLFDKIRKKYEGTSNQGKKISQNGGCA